MSTTQLDRSRSPTMPCILLVYIPYIEKSLPALRLGWASRSPITGAAHTVIPIQRQHAHKIAISDIYSALETAIVGRCVSLQKAQRKRRHDYPDAEVARRDRAKPAAQSSQATKNCRGSETAEARERRDRDRRKRRLDSESETHDACIAENVSSYIS